MLTVKDGCVSRPNPNLEVECPWVHSYYRAEEFPNHSLKLAWLLVGTGLSLLLFLSVSGAKVVFS